MMKKVIKFIGLFLIMTAVFGIPAAGATLTVTKTADTNDGSCSASDCSLREAIAVANASASDDSITFAIPTTDVGCLNEVCTITLGGTQLTINSAATAGTLTISNPNGTAANLLVSGNNASRVFNVVNGANLTLNNLTVTGGRVSGSNNNGGGIFNNGGTITLTNCAVSNNVLSGPNNNGGGILNIQGTVTLTNCSVSNNVLSGVGTNSASAGGGIYSFFGTLNIIGSTVSNNSITGTVNDGGGIFVESSTVNITGSTISNNSASGGSNENYGGGIFVKFEVTLKITNSTISGNSVTGSGRNQGGGLFILDSPIALDLTNSTVSNNSAIGGSQNSGGGIYANSGPTNVRNSIISGNTAVSDPDFNITLNPNENNLIGNAAQVRLAPLGFYGGATMTHALLSGSTAINTGNNCVVTQTCTDFNAPVALPADQRGASRVGNVDIGAFELNNSANGGTFVANLPNGTQNIAYSFTLVSDTQTTVYCVSAGNLPPGLGGIPLCSPPLTEKADELAPTAALVLAGTPTQGGTFNFAVSATNGGNTNVTNYALFVMAPTAAAVSVAGNVLTPDGRGLQNAIVTMTDARGAVRSYRTTTFGRFRFDNVSAGETYIFQVQSKRFTFAPQIVSVAEDLADLSFTAQY